MDGLLPIEIEEIQGNLNLFRFQKVREIEFHGLTMDGRKLVSGSLSVEFDGTHHIAWWESELTEPEVNLWEPVQRVAEVIPETVRQFSGYLDKNGKKIFEGSILRVGGIVTCVYYTDSSGFRLLNNAYHLSAYTPEHVEVLGHLFFIKEEAIVKPCVLQ